ncbi:choice-of-anchor D domain-containing protein [Nocardioides sp. W7]|uniref:choice-of-anchor D domain-containing protein n=1 Tax=Nocardioides sp. W7 TaxID=2931390 RepID=UPI001FD50619|nr:choice-of-anchor D domain-containing protein [Nocardioides sp. W7]
MKTSTVAGVLVGLLGLTLTPVAAQAATVPTIDAVVKVGQVMDYSFPCSRDILIIDQWFSGGEPVEEYVANTLTVRPEDLGRRLSVERVCAGTGEKLRTPESGIVTGSGSQVPVIGTLAKPPIGDPFFAVKDTQSSVIGDPTDPGVDLFVGQLGADNQTLVDASALTVSVSAVTKGQRVRPLDASAVTVSSTGSVRHVSFAPTDRGNVTLVFTVTGTTGATDSYSLDYYASGATTPTSRVLQMSSDASTAIAAGDGHLFVADDEAHEIRLYDAEVSGMPVAVFGPGLGGGEDDYESSARSGDSVFWLGAHGNSKKGEVQASRSVVYETTISGSGADAKLAPVGNKYNGLRDDLIAWDQAHGSRYGFAAATAVGQAPDGPAQFNIEASEFAPDGNTLYLGFRGPLTGRVPGGKALIVPVTNIKQLTLGQGTTATFGQPIELDLGGHSIREIRKNAAGEYLLLTADAMPARPEAQLEQLLWYWDGNPTTAPEKLTTVVPPDVEENRLSPGAWEGIGAMPAQLEAGAQVRLIMDQGAVGPYAPLAPPGMTGTEAAAKWETPQMKDLAADQLRKARTDVVTLTGAMGVRASVTGAGAFAEQRVGATSAAQQVTVTNAGTKPLTISAVSLTDEDGVSAQDFRVDGAACLGTTLTVGATCQVPVRFAPVRAGQSSTAKLQVTGPVGSSVWSLALTGSSTAVFTTVSVPTISNLAPMAGDTLTASTPAWSPVAALAHQWLRDGQPIGGAVASSYAVTDADVGHRISVTVTGTAAGHVPETRTSAPTQSVAVKPTPVVPTPHVTTKVKATVSVKGLTKRRVQVRVTAPGVPTARLNQTITVKVAGATKPYRVKLVDGRATIRLAGARAAQVRTGQRARVTVLVPKLTTTLTTPAVVTTYLVARSTQKRTVVVRR